MHTHTHPRTRRIAVLLCNLAAESWRKWLVTLVNLLNKYVYSRFYRWGTTWQSKYFEVWSLHQTKGLFYWRFWRIRLAFDREVLDQHRTDQYFEILTISHSLDHFSWRRVCVFGYFWGRVWRRTDLSKSKSKFYLHHAVPGLRSEKQMDNIVVDFTADWRNSYQVRWRMDCNIYYINLILQGFSVY